MEKIAKVIDQNPENAISLLKEVMSQIDGEYERYNITFLRLFFIYSQLGQFQEALNVLLEGQKEGFFYPLSTGERKFQQFEEFESFNKCNFNLFTINLKQMIILTN